jgi:hypothetical protein
MKNYRLTAPRPRARCLSVAEMYAAGFTKSGAGFWPAPVGVTYDPMLSECRRMGKRVFVAALSSGLSPKIRLSADRFIDFDGSFFYPPESLVKKLCGSFHAFGPDG